MSATITKGERTRRAGTSLRPEVVTQRYTTGQHQAPRGRGTPYYVIVDGHSETRESGIMLSSQGGLSRPAIDRIEDSAERAARYDRVWAELAAALAELGWAAAGGTWVHADHPRAGEMHEVRLHSDGRVVVRGGATSQKIYEYEYDAPETARRILSLLV